MIFVNFKTYKEATGISAVKLAKVMEEVSSESQIKLIPVVQAPDVREVVQNVKLEVWVQNVDASEYGAHTGSIIPEAVVEDGATGTFLNHSEHPFFSFDELEKTHNRAKGVGLKTLVFASNIAHLVSIVNLNPDFVSYEPPEFVGSTTTSVSQERPEIISEAVEIAKGKSLPLIVGAGIKSEEDIRKSLELGASGFAIAKSIVTSLNPKEELEKLVAGYK